MELNKVGVVKIHTEIIQLVPIIKRARRAHLNKIGILVDETRRNLAEEDEDNAFLEDDLFAEPVPSEPPSPAESPKGEKQKAHWSSIDNTDNEIRQTEEQFANNIRMLKAQRKEIFIEASEIPLPLQESEEKGFHGFSTVLDEIESIKTLIERNKKSQDAKIWKIEKKVYNISSSVKKIEETINGVSTNIQDVYCMVEVNSARISATEEKSYNLGLSLKAFENWISKRFHAIEE